ncbi:MAG: hypothetical protein ABSB95_04155 [Dissulfurispiraceae bacterium]|jgi:hypothetical protein
MDKIIIIEITHQDSIFIQIRTDRGTVESFVVTLLCDIQGQRYEVVRFDSGHGSPHKDILDTDGHVARKVWYHYLSNAEAANMAIADIKEHYESYRERYIKWLRVN